MERKTPGLEEAAEAFMQGIRTGQIKAFVAIGLTDDQVEYFISFDDETGDKLVSQIIQTIGFMDLLKNRLGRSINLDSPIIRGPQPIKEKDDD